MIPAVPRPGGIVPLSIAFHLMTKKVICYERKAYLLRRTHEEWAMLWLIAIALCMITGFYPANYSKPIPP